MGLFTRRRLGALAAGLVLVAASALSPSTRVGYLARATVFQAEMLLGRVDLESARQGLDASELQRLDWVAEIKAFGASQGLSATENYGTLNPSWKHTIYNVSASEPLAFRPTRWWFPIVGSVPYLGFFGREEALAEARRLEARGLDVYVRTAGAYSTLGWFRDPLLPPMLAWTEARLADTLLHELAHATLWVPGSVRFNESFASFVGREASLRYLVAKYGDDSPEVQAEARRRADGTRWRQLLLDTHQALDAVYRDSDTPVDARLRAKREILAGLPIRVLEAGFSDPSPYLRAARRGPWNNARLAQFRAYNDPAARFEPLLEEVGGDLLAFIDLVRERTAQVDDPFEAIVAPR